MLELSSLDDEGKYLFSVAFLTEKQLKSSIKTHNQVGGFNPFEKYYIVKLDHLPR